MFGPWGNPDEGECRRIVEAALDAGVNFVDTADVYGGGVTEEIVGRALKGRRDDIVLATKFNNPMGQGPNQRGNSRRWIMSAVDASLRRLDTDWIDLYQAHRPDPTCDIDETLGALSELVRAGKIRAIGTSTFPAEQIVEAQWVAERRGREPFTSEQPPYSLFARGAEVAVLPACLEHRLGVVAWSPLNGGWLTGKYRRDHPVDSASRAVRAAEHFDYQDPVRERKLDLVDELLALGLEAGVPLIQLALAFVLEHPAVTAAIVGPRTVTQLVDQLPAAEVRLDAQVLDRLDSLVPPGVNLNPRDAGWVPPALDPATRRRRP